MRQVYIKKNQTKTLIIKRKLKEGGYYKSFPDSIFEQRQGGKKCCCCGTLGDMGKTF